MYTVESLLAKYRDKIIIVDDKKNSLDVLKDLVDIKELDLNIVHPFQMEILKQNIKYYEDYDGTPIKLHFYEVIRNSKSEFYYKELEKTGNMSYRSYFKKPTIFVVYEETFGLENTNSNSLHRDYIMLCGVTQKDLQEKNQYLFNYLSYISAWEELKDME